MLHVLYNAVHACLLIYAPFVSLHIISITLNASTIVPSALMEPIQPSKPRLPLFVLHAHLIALSVILNINVPRVKVLIIYILIVIFRHVKVFVDWLNI